MLESNIVSNTKHDDLNQINFDDREELRHIHSCSDSSLTNLQTPNHLNLEAIPSDLPSLSPSVSSKMYTNPYDYIDYDKCTFDSWFDEEKHKYLIAIQECAASHNVGLP